MAYGIPIIAPNIGGICEWLSDGENGILVRPNCSNSLADAINLLVSNDKLREEMGKKGKEQLKNKFKPEQHINKLVDLFTKLINERQG